MVAGATFRFSTRADGDFHIGADPAALVARRRNLASGSWTWLRQVHGSRVVTVEHPGHHSGEAADAAVTSQPGAVLAVHTADCVPVLLFDADAGVVGAAHAGWRGLVDGVLEGTVDAMADLGATDVVAVIGPHIRSRCYEFGADDLATVVRHFGAQVRATTAWGTPALDLGVAVRTALDGRATVHQEAGCTACEPERFFSHRARADAARHAATIVLDP